MFSNSIFDKNGSFLGLGKAKTVNEAVNNVMAAYHPERPTISDLTGLALNGSMGITPIDGDPTNILYTNLVIACADEVQFSPVISYTQNVQCSSEGLDTSIPEVTVTLINFDAKSVVGMESLGQIEAATVAEFLQKCFVIMQDNHVKGIQSVSCYYKGITVTFSADYLKPLINEYMSDNNEESPIIAPN